jgi:C4-dicarboxylate-specific signal transduction histidine kinase
MATRKPKKPAVPPSGPSENRGSRSDDLEILRRRVAELEAAEVRHDELELELRRLSRDLSERVKELNCLYAISKLRDRHGVSTDEVLQDIVDLIPSAWQYPEITCARLSLDGREFKTIPFVETAWELVSDIVVNGVPGGTIEVCYTAERPAAGEGPFLREERTLIEAIAERVARLLEYERAERQARERDQQMIQLDKLAALGTMVSGVAHEINNPNNFIMLNAPVLSEAYDSFVPILEDYYRENGDFLVGGIAYTEMKENIPALFSGILDGAKRIRTIVESLKGFARVEACDLSRVVDVNEVVRSALVLVNNQVKRSTRRFSTEQAESLPAIRGNGQRLEQVIINLVQNACEALSDKLQGISISTAYDSAEDAIVVQIRDEGVGIPPDKMPHILDPFFTTKRPTGGTGLGLSVSASIVKDHGGTLSFASTPGKGTTATLTLPVGARPSFSRGAVR